MTESTRKEREAEMPLFEHVRVTLQTTTGPCEVEGVAHALAPGLAITSNHFGEFDVTHLLSGKAVCKKFERFANAAIALLALSRCADWMKTGEEIAAYLRTPAGEEPANVPGFDLTTGGVTRPQTRREIVRHYKGIGRLAVGEFPWEDDSTSPNSAVVRLIREFATSASRRSDTPTSTNS